MSGYLLFISIFKKGLRKVVTFSLAQGQPFFSNWKKSDFFRFQFRSRSNASNRVHLFSSSVHLDFVAANDTSLSL